MTTRKRAEGSPKSSEMKPIRSGGALDARMRALKLFREIDRSVKLKNKIRNELGMSAEDAAHAVGDDVH